MLQSGFLLGLQSSEGLPEAGGSASKLTQVAVDSIGSVQRQRQRHGPLEILSDLRPSLALAANQSGPVSHVEQQMASQPQERTAEAADKSSCPIRNSGSCWASGGSWVVGTCLPCSQRREVPALCLQIGYCGPVS